MEIFVYVVTRLLDLDTNIDSRGSGSIAAGSTDTDDLYAAQGTSTDHRPGDTNSDTGPDSRGKRGPEDRRRYGFQAPDFYDALH